MIIRVIDIPPGGKSIDFEIEAAQINKRLNHQSNIDKDVKRNRVLELSWHFVNSPKTTLTLNVEGRTVMINGQAEGSYSTICSRCTEETVKSMSIPIAIVLKPYSDKARPEEEIEDLSLGFYDGKEVDCGAIVEEYLILGLPYVVACSEKCKGLCPTCGVNLNHETCKCQEQKKDAFDERFKVLRQIKFQ